MFLTMDYNDMDDTHEEEDHSGHSRRLAQSKAVLSSRKSEDHHKRALRQETTLMTAKQQLRRTAEDGEEIAPGLGWMLYKENSGFCDGSAQSTCKRNADSDCLMAGHNDGTQAGLLGDALSGWLVLNVPNVKNGVILARFQTDVDGNINEQTEGWTRVNQGNEVEDDNEQRRRRRKLYIPRDFEFDYAINGKITTLSGRDFINMGVDVADDFTVWPLLLDEEKTKRGRKRSNDEGETVQVAIRIRSVSKRGATILLSHLYYA